MGIFSTLHERFPGVRGEEDFPFARHTTIGCGGTAAAAFSPSSAEELALLLRVLEAENIPYCFLGAGANVLPREGRFEGAVIRFDGFSSLRAEGDTIVAGAGVTGGRLLGFARAHALGGAEFLTGIPMTAGGAVVMNAGVREGHIGDLIEEVYCVAGGVPRIFSARECAFGEKTSVFQSGIAVTGMRLRLRQETATEIASRTEYFRKKRAHLPKGRSMGCVFVNPAGLSAGAIIEACGLKGTKLGGARVSEIHANFILNEGGSSEDIEALIALVKRRVQGRTGILLTEEIRRIP